MIHLVHRHLSSILDHRQTSAMESCYYITVVIDSETSIHRLKNKGDIDIWPLSGTNPSMGSEQTKVLVSARAMGDTCC